MSVAAGALEAAESALAEIDLDRPGLAEGCYLIGSAVMGDWHEGRSDVDLVLVTAAPVDQPVAAGDVELRWVTWDQLAMSPVDAGHVAGTHPDWADPVTWRQLATIAHALRGPSPPPVFDVTAELADWNRGNLATYWSGWSEAATGLNRIGAWALTDDGFVWGALGPLRLHFTIATGDITSKAGAAEWALDTYAPEWHRVIGEALRIRRGGDGRAAYRSPLARRRELVHLMRHTIASA